MINKRNNTITTVRHVSQCSSLRYSFSHKCPGLVGASSRLQSDALCENPHHHADYSSAQWADTTFVRYATRTVLAESCVSAGHQGKAFDRYFTTPCVCSSWRSWHRRCGRRACSSRCQLLVVVVGTVGLLAWLKRVGVSANGVAHSTQELQRVVSSR